MSWLGVPDDATPRPWPWRALIGVGLTALGIALCLTLLFFAMRNVMDLGGFVAQGGPYVIAHPAPDWMWVMPVSVVLGMMLGFANAALAAAAGGFKLALPAWSAVFLSLGWNFAEYGVDPPGEGGLVWAWLVCAVVFFVMGSAPLLLLVAGRWTPVGRARAQMRLLTPVGRRGNGVDSRSYHRTYLAINVVAVLAGGALGTLTFTALTG